MLLVIAVTVLPSSILAATRTAQYEQLGTKGNKTRLVNNWTITPAGTQTLLGDLPLNSILSPNGHFLLVSNDGAVTQHW